MLERRWLANPQRGNRRVLFAVIEKHFLYRIPHSACNRGRGFVGKEGFMKIVILDFNGYPQKLLVLQGFLAFFARPSQGDEESIYLVFALGFGAQIPL